MFYRPAGAAIAFREEIWHALRYRVQDKPVFAAAAFAERSMHFDKIARYFLINQKCNLLIAGDETPTNIRLARDIRAEWIGLPDNFSGRFTISPTQRQAGFFLAYHQPLCAVCDIEFLRHSWLNFELPIAYVENNLHPKQFDIVNPSPTAPHDILEAFNQPSWCFGKIAGKRHRVSPADLRVEFGKTYMAENYFEIAYYSVLLVPMSARQDPEFLFSPVVGYNGHWGLGGGAKFQIPLNWNTCTVAHAIFMYLESIYLFHNKQKRTFDLKGKPWSRYMQYNFANGLPGQNIPGVNLLTFDAISAPYGVVDFCLGYRLIRGIAEIEVGYSIWGHGNEKVKFKKPYMFPRFSELSQTITYNFGFGIAGVGARDDGGATSSNTSTIAVLNPESDGNIFIPIDKYDIANCSAEAAGVLLQRLHCAFAIAPKSSCQGAEGSFSAGIYAELPHRNSAIPMWGGWVAIGMHF